MLAICDDEEKQREYVSGLVNAWAKLGRHLVEIKEFQDAESFLLHYDAEKDFDILLLDVEMGKLSGIDLAKEIQSDLFLCMIFSERCIVDDKKFSMDRTVFIGKQSIKSIYDLSVDRQVEAFQFLRKLCKVVPLFYLTTYFIFYFTHDFITNLLVFVLIL